MKTIKICGNHNGLSGAEGFSMQSIDREWRRFKEYRKRRWLTRYMERAHRHSRLYKS